MLRTQAVVKFGAPLVVVERPLPVPKGNEVLVRTTFAGMCHSDLHIWEGYFTLGGEHKLPLNRPMPFTLGHEIEGEVVAAGPSVPKDAYVPNKSYAVYPWIGCMNEHGCVQCRSDSTNHHCESKKSKGFTDGNSIYGGYASHSLVPHWKYLVDYAGTGIPRGLGCVYMCSGLTAFSALKKVIGLAVRPSDVMILGLGGLGFQGLCFAQALLGGMPLVGDIDDVKLAEARKRGCQAFNTRDAAAAAVAVKKGSFDGTGIAAVVDFVGASATQNFAESVLRRGGKSVVVGLFGGMLQRPLVMWPLKARSVEGSFVGSYNEVEEMMDMLRKNKVEPPPHHFRSIHDASRSLQDLKAGKIMGRCVFRHDWPTAKV